MRFFCRHLSLLSSLGKTDPCFRGSYAPTLELYYSSSRRAVVAEGWRARRNKDTAILREKSRTRFALYPPNTEKVFPTPRGFRRRWRLAAMAKREVEVRGGWFKLLDISTSWGCPFASTTTTDAHPKVSNRDSGFWGSFPLPPPSSLPSFGAPLSYSPRPFT